MTSNEFSPYKYFSHILSLWWLVSITTLIGGALGFVFFHLHPPIYEATATYLVSIDLNRFPFQGVREDLIQYNEDMAVNTTQGAINSSMVLNGVLDQLRAQGISLTITDLLQNYTIERKLDIWELRYRSQVPRDAQTIVNIWAQIGYQAMVSWQSTGKAPAYVVFQPPSLAAIPNRPVLYGRSNLMLGGAVIGLVFGIVITPLIKREKPPSAQHD
jgi:capsular polysaccharide biosynthesis protein